MNADERRSRTGTRLWREPPTVGYALCPPITCPSGRRDRTSADNYIIKDVTPSPYEFHLHKKEGPSQASLLPDPFNSPKMKVKRPKMVLFQRNPYSRHDPVYPPAGSSTERIKRIEVGNRYLNQSCYTLSSVHGKAFLGHVETNAAAPCPGVAGPPRFFHS